MKCNEIPFGTGYCAYAIYLPWKVKFEWEDESQRRPKCVSIDKCLLPKTKLIYGEPKNNGEWEGNCEQNSTD